MRNPTTNCMRLSPQYPSVLVDVVQRGLGSGHNPNKYGGHPLPTRLRLQRCQLMRLVGSAPTGRAFQQYVNDLKAAGAAGSAVCSFGEYLRRGQSSRRWP